MKEEAAPATRSDPWLDLARAAFDSSSDWYDANLRKQWEKNLSLAQNKHPPGSKYFTEAYRHRSRLFRPKTRANVRANEAAAAGAFFSTDDVLRISPQNDNDDAQRASAEIMQELLDYRLKKTIPWFQTLIGAYQDAQVMGIVVSKQYWEYEEQVKKYKIDAQHEDGTIYLDPETGEPIQQEVTETKVLLDRPCVELIPPENIRIDPAASWIDPVNTSPYVIRLIPMYLGDVLERMNVNDPKTGSPKWKKLSASQLLASAKDDRYESTHRRRTGRSDDYEDNHEVNEYSTVWIHENIVRKGGKDWVYWTAGTEFMLTDPKPIEEVYLHGKRPYVIGYSVIETHKPFPAGVVELTQDLQTAANDIQNQRFDNVQLVLNKRYRIKRGANVDINALMRNVPGGAVLMNDPNSDVVIDSTPDVTTSSYAEQDRLNMDFDELAGAFSSSSVASNRQLNQTVGGMNMLSGSASQATEYLLRVFAETWVEPVLRQLVLLEQAYETDQTVLAIAAERAELYQKYGIDEATDQLLQNELTVSVSVGVGATNPQLQLEKFMAGLNSIAAIPELVQTLDVREVSKEIFGKLGYKDGERFYMDEEKLAKMAEGQGPSPDQMKMEIEAQKLQLENQRLQLDAQIQMQRLEYDARAKAIEIQQEREIEHAKLALQQDLTVAELESKLQLERSKQDLQVAMASEGQMAKSVEAKIRQMESERKVAIEVMKETTKRREMALKQKMGSGI